MISTLLNISLTKDGVFEGNETFTLTIIESLLPKDVYVGQPRKTKVTIIDIGESRMQ